MLKSEDQAHKTIGSLLTQGGRVLQDPKTDELDGRMLRVITLADKVTIHNAFPDRGFRP